MGTDADIATPSEPAARGSKALIWIMITGICAVVVLIGSFLPWAHVADITVGGIDNDGAVTLVIAILAIFFALWGSGRVGIGGHPAIPLSLLVACMALIAIIGIADTSDVQKFDSGIVGSFVDVGVSIGLWLVLIAGIIGLATSIVGLVLGVKRK